MSSEGAAGASAAARRRGAASRVAAEQQARAPEEGIPRRPRAMNQEKARTTMPNVQQGGAVLAAEGKCAAATLARDAHQDADG